MKRTGEKGKMVALILSGVESCIQIQGSRERNQGGMEAVGTSWGQTDKSSKNPQQAAAKGMLLKGPHVSCASGMVSGRHLNFFIELWLTCKKLYIFNIYNSMSWGISIYPWNHYHHQDHTHIHFLPEFPPFSVLLLALLLLLLLFCVCDKNTLNIRSTLSANLKNAILLAIGRHSVT